MAVKFWNNDKLRGDPGVLNRTVVIRNTLQLSGAVAVSVVLSFGLSGLGVCFKLAQKSLTRVSGCYRQYPSLEKILGTDKVDSRPSEDGVESGFDSE